MLRLMVPLSTGILMQWYWQPELSSIIVIGGICLLFLLVFYCQTLAGRFTTISLQGFLLQCLLVITGATLCWNKDIRNKPEWFAHHNAALFQLTIEEHLVEKANSYKALATVHTIYQSDSSLKTKGKVILYFKKSDIPPSLQYGSQILVFKPLQEIKNAGNPGSFDYKRFCLFQGITHQVYLTDHDFKQLELKKIDALKHWLLEGRVAIVNIIRRYIDGKKEQGLAEALMIGYKQDLDKALVESYSNTGVVHIIAISGLHLGIIYMILLFVTKPLKKKRTQWLRFTIIIIGLWSFTLLAGAQPSVLRSSLMFSCMALSTLLNRRAIIFNTLALSAFILLCINPFYLWDVGFQLSYCAVLSILLFFRPVYNWFYFPNKLIDYIWQLAAVSIAAQVLTLPLSLFHFHQFPLLFLLANLVAVPLATFILIGSILLCVICFFEPAAQLIGYILSFVIRLMNVHVERLDHVSFAVWNGISLTPIQTVILYVLIASVFLWLIERQKQAIWAVLCSALLFIAFRSYTFIVSGRQKQIIVYNVPKLQAIDVVFGRKVSFIGDPLLLQDEFLYNFHIRPSRILHRLDNNDSAAVSKSFTINNKRILIIDGATGFKSIAPKPTIDLLVLSGNPRLYISEAASSFNIHQIVIDGSVPAWKAKLWKADAERLGISCHHVVEKGAFVMKL